MPDDVAVVVAPAGTPPAAPVAPAAPAAPETPPAPSSPAVPPKPASLPIAPVAPPAAVPDAPAADHVVEYNPTGDPALDVALGFMGKLGLAHDHPAMAAAGTGDFGLLKATLATMGDKARGWEQMVALGEDAFKRQSEKAQAQSDATTAAVHQVAGGEANWKTMQAWAAQNADPAEKEELNRLFDSGVMGARAAATMIAQAYQAAKGTIVQPASALRPGAAATPATVNGPLTPGEYHTAVRDLHARLGNQMDASPEYAQLRARLRR